MFLFIENAMLDEIDLAFAISSAAADAETTFQRMKDTIKQIMQEYKTEKLRYGLLVFGDKTISPLNFEWSPLIKSFLIGSPCCTCP